MTVWVGGTPVLPSSLLAWEPCGGEVAGEPCGSAQPLPQSPSLPQGLPRAKQALERQERGLSQAPGSFWGRGLDELILW